MAGSSERWIACLAAASGMCSIASIARAQVPPPTSPPVAAPAGNAAGDIIVTAQKREERINDIPLSITAVTGKSLVQRGIIDTADLGRVVAGFNYTKSSFGAPVYQLRGIGFYDTSLSGAPAVSVYTDQVPLPFATMTRGATFDLERVEVLKGPQGTLFGQNSTGGAINYIAAKPTRDLHAGFDLDYGSYGHVMASGFVSGPITDTLRARFAVERDYGGGWQKSLTRRGDTLGDANLSIARLLLDWTPNDRLSVGINLNGWIDRSDNQAAQLIGFAGNPANYPIVALSPLAPPKARAADWDRRNDLRRHDNFGQASIRIGYDLGGDFKLTSLTAYDILDRKHSYLDNDGTAAQDYFADVPGKLETVTQELRLEGKAGTGFRWMIGGNYEHDNTFDVLQSYLTQSRYANTLPSVRVENRQRTDTYSAFANADWTFAPALTLHGGIRYTDQHRAFQGCTRDTGDGRSAAFQSRVATQLSGTPVVIPPGGCITLGADGLPTLASKRLDQSNISWRAALDWKVAPGQLLYASISRGYKAGTFPTLTATRAAALTAAVQESVLAYEVGFKLALLDRKLQLNGAAFYYDYKDKQTVGRLIDPIAGPIFALVNIPKSRIYGAELQLDWQPVKALRFSGAASYTDSRILDDFTNINALGQIGDFGGESFPLTPKWQANIDGEYTHPIGDAEAFFGADARYQSRSHAGLGDLPMFRVKGYAGVDLRAGVRLKDPDITISGYVRNLTNTYSWNNVLNTTDVIVRYANPPRTIGLHIAYRY